MSNEMHPLKVREQHVDGVRHESEASLRERIAAHRAAGRTTVADALENELHARRGAPPIASFAHAVNMTAYVGRLHGLGTNFNGDHWGPTDDPRELLRRIDKLRGAQFMDSEQGHALLAYADGLEQTIAEAEAESKGGQ